MKVIIQAVKYDHGREIARLDIHTSLAFDEGDGTYTISGPAFRAACRRFYRSDSCTWAKKGQRWHFEPKGMKFCRELSGFENRIRLSRI